MTLLELASLGTEALGDDAVPLTDTGADALLALRPGEPIERLALLAAGCRDVLSRAARAPTLAPPPLPPAPPEPRDVLPDRIASALLSMFGSDNRDLLPAVLPRVAATGRVLPPAALRAALRRCPEDLRAGLRPLLGARARWLAEHGASWTWLLDSRSGPSLPDLLAAFDEAASTERPALLRAIRAHDPKAGRDALRSTWTSEPVKSRLALVPPLAENLSDADEPLLAQIHGKDRSDRVKAAAARLLARISTSAFAQERLAAARAAVSLVPRAKPKMSLVKAMFGRRSALPPTLETRLGHTELLALVELVSPTALAAAWSLEPREVLLGLQDDDEALLLGLSEGALLHGEGEWTEPLLDRWARMPQAARKRDRNVADRLLDVLPAASRSARIIEAMHNHEATDWWPSLMSWDAQWPEPLGARWLLLVRRHLLEIDTGEGESTTYARTWRLSLVPAAARLPVSQLAAASRLAIESPEGSPRWFRALSDFQNRIQLRLQVEEALAALPVPKDPR